MSHQPRLPGPVRVLFVGGHGRSGSTLVARALGAAPGAVCVGELRYLWSHGVVHDEPCGCGRPFRRCDFWQRVGQAAFGGWRREEGREMVALHRSLMRIRHVPRHLLPTPAARGRLDAYADATTRVYRAVAEVSGSRVVVDSSKFLTSALLLHRAPGVDLRVLQLVRGPHGVAHSWARQRPRTDRRGAPPMAVHPPAQAALEWLAFNAALESLRLTRTPWALLRYEDFVARPGAEAARALAFAGLPVPGAGPAHIAGTTVDLPVDHGVAGNPMRTRTGPEPLRADDAWRTEMPPPRRRLITALTAPGMLRYGYGLREGQAPGRGRGGKQGPGAGGGPAGTAGLAPR